MENYENNLVTRNSKIRSKGYISFHFLMKVMSSSESSLWIYMYNQRNIEKDNNLLKNTSLV